MRLAIKLDFPFNFLLCKQNQKIQKCKWKKINENWNEQIEHWCTYQQKNRSGPIWKRFFQAKNNQFHPFESLKMEIFSSSPLTHVENHKFRNGKFSLSLWNMSAISLSCLKCVHMRDICREMLCKCFVLLPFPSQWTREEDEQWNQLADGPSSRESWTKCR